jgi:hypothetical protein
MPGGRIGILHGSPSQLSMDKPRAQTQRSSLNSFVSSSLQLQAHQLMQSREENSQIQQATVL